MGRDERLRSFQVRTHLFIIPLCISGCECFYDGLDKVRSRYLEGREIGLTPIPITNRGGSLSTIVDITKKC